MRAAWTAEEEAIVQQGMDAGVKAYRLRPKLPGRSLGAILSRMDVLKSRVGQKKEASPDDVSHLVVDSRQCFRCGSRWGNCDHTRGEP